MSLKENYEVLKAQRISGEKGDIVDRLDECIANIENKSQSCWQHSTYNLYEELIPSALNEGKYKLFAYLCERQAEKTEDPIRKQILSTLANIVRKKVMAKGDLFALNVLGSAESLINAALNTKNKSKISWALTRARAMIGVQMSANEHIEANKPILVFEAPTMTTETVKAFGNEIVEIQGLIFSIQKTVNTLNEVFTEIANTKGTENKFALVKELADTITDIYRQKDNVSQVFFDETLGILAKKYPLLEETHTIDDDTEDTQYYDDIDEGFGYEEE